MNYAISAPHQIDTCIHLPASKSISARALVVNALCPRPGLLTNVALCDDTDAMMRGLEVTRGHIDVGASGTALRLLAAYHACQEGHEVVIDGVERLRHRPVQPLVEALKHMGADITCDPHTAGAPLTISGRRLHGGKIAMPGDVSSQFATALMLIAPIVGGLTLHLTGGITSRPYIDMTMSVMRHYGIDAHWEGETIIVAPGQYAPADLTIEADWSAASYWLALQALLPQSHITLAGLQPQSWQGDSRMLTFMEQMGMEARWQHDGTLATAMTRIATCCCSTFADLNGTPDLAPTMTVMLCLLGRPFRLTGLRALRSKESDRTEALRRELAKLGYRITLEGDDAISWHFESCEQQPRPVIDTHGDHRIAMAFALAATRHPGIVIKDTEVVEKSYPAFWRHLSQAGFTLKQVV